MRHDKIERSPRRSKAPILIAILLIVILVVGWHIFAPMLGLTVAFTGAAGGMVIATIGVLCVSIVLFFILSGIGMLILGLIAVVWTLVAIVLFPILFPLLVPIVILLLLIGFLFGRKKS